MEVILCRLMKSIQKYLYGKLYLFNSCQCHVGKVYFEKRRAAAREHLPRLTYIVSDVVIFVSNLDFADHSYFDQVPAVIVIFLTYFKVYRSTFLAATEGVHNAIKPNCILVSNKIVCSVGELDVERTTNEFFRIHDNDRDLLKVLCVCSCFANIQVYGEIKCVRLPNWNANAVQFKAQASVFKVYFYKNCAHGILRKLLPMLLILVFH